MDVDFPFETLASIIGGHSALDIPRLNIHTPEEAEAFLRTYGFNPDIPREAREIGELRDGAVDFIEEVLLEGERIADPDVRRASARDLLLWASTREVTPRQRWSCAVLRVAHTLAHAYSYFNEQFGPTLRRQILDRFRVHLRGDEAEGTLALGEGPDAIPLTAFEVREQKSVRSVALKLLNSYESVASPVFDWIGVRFVTRHRFDALLVVRYLRARSVITFTNVIPSRSRNSLIEMDWLEPEMSRLATGPLTPEQRLAHLRALVRERALPEGHQRDYNRHSSTGYHAIQFTCREMVRIPSDAESHGRFFFPYEIQILDAECYAESRTGRASHTEYKRRQLENVRRRVLGSLVDRG